MAPGLPDDVPATAGEDRNGDLPVPVEEVCVHARVYDDAGPAGVLRGRRLPCCLLLVRRTSAPRICLTPLNTWPAHSPINASRQSSRIAAHDSGSVWLARPCTVTDFHRLPSAGLPAHPDHPITGPQSLPARRFLRSPRPHGRSRKARCSRPLQDDDVVDP